MAGSDQSGKKGKYFWLLALSSVGIVYGDIGTSPLYALRECFHETHGVEATPENILGVLSLILYSLILVISIKYMLLILRADNKGEGGILALMEIILPQKKNRRFYILLALGFFGAALLYGDGMITPAISVLSAIEGLKVATPIFEPYIIPITIGVLFGLFFFQKQGTSGVGKIFGPVMTLWFFVIGVLGFISIFKNPDVLQAFNPFYAYQFFRNVGFKALYVLGAVFLVVTGGEALYADLGHFGKKPIRVSWVLLVLPALLINYFGQGALLLRDTEAVVNPFYHLSPDWMLYPMVILATSATVIASQAVISGSFSLTFQAVQLGYLPRMVIQHTSKMERGQIYIPQLNWFLFLSTVILVLAFKNSSNLAAAYGVAISTTMVITDILLLVVMRKRWHWNIILAVIVSIFFLTIDLGYLAANFLKILRGGWVPLLIAGVIYLLMETWRKGRKMLIGKIGEISTKLDEFVKSINEKDYKKVNGSAIYLFNNTTYTPPSLEHNLKHNKVLHKKIYILTINITNTPIIRKEKNWEIRKLDDIFYQIRADFGYLQKVNIQHLMESMQEKEKKYKIDLNDVTYFVGRETLISRKDIGMNIFQAKLFSFMADNALDATRFYHLPVTKVIEIGQRVNV